MKKADDLADRRKAATAAKAALLEKFKARPAADDPEVLAKAAARQAIAAAREERIAARQLEERLKREQREAEEAIAAEAARIEREAAEAAAAEERAAAELARKPKPPLSDAELKAIRDARYAARKMRKQG